MMPIEKNTKDTITEHTERPRTEAVEREAGAGERLGATIEAEPTLVGIGAPASARAFLSAVSPNKHWTVVADEASLV